MSRGSSHEDSGGEKLFEKSFSLTHFKNFFFTKGFIERERKKELFFQKRNSQQNNFIPFLISSILIHLVILFTGVFNLGEAWEKKENLSPLIILQEFQSQNLLSENSMANSPSKNLLVHKVRRIEKSREMIEPPVPKMEARLAYNEPTSNQQENPKETSPSPSQSAPATVTDHSLRGSEDSGSVFSREVEGGRVYSPASGADPKARSDWKKAYRRKVYSRIASAKKYPYSARRAGMEGRVVVHFTISRDGNLLSVSLVKPCEYPLLNSDALDWVRRAAPFPPFPLEADESSMSFTYGLRYDLTE